MKLHHALLKAPDVLKQNVNKLYDNHPHAVHIGHNLTHGAYFLFVFLQGHGFYTYFAGALFCGTLFALLRSHDEDET